MEMSISTKRVLRRTLVTISITILTRFAAVQAGCGNVHEIEPSFHTVLTDAALHKGLPLSSITALMTAYRNRGAAPRCEDAPLLPHPWRGGQVPFVIQRGFSKASIDRIWSDLRHVNSLTCLSFVARGYEQQYVEFRPAPQHCFITLQALYESTFAARVPQGEPVRHPSSTEATPPVRVYPVLLSPQQVEGGGVLGQVMVALGFNRQEIRFDRDYHVKMVYDDDLLMLRQAFEKSPPSALDRLFPYDALSVTHISALEARLWNVSLQPARPGITFRDTALTRLSQIDIKKIQYLYCNGTSTPAPPASSVQNISRSASETHPGGEQSTTDAPSGVPWEELLSTGDAMVTDVLASSGATGWPLHHLLLFLALPSLIVLGSIELFTGV